MKDPVYHISVPPPGIRRLPVLLSVPHGGTDFPAGIINEYKEDMLPPDDTDWFVNRLYDFAPAMGITLLSAVYSRWVIDLNRDPGDVPLYNDGRVITGLCTTTDFSGNPIYKDERKQVDTAEVNRRKTLYFEPYHNKIQELLDEMKEQSGKVLLWDCHSIRQRVPAIHSEPFADLILGSADDRSASPELVHTSLESLTSTSYSTGHNYPFKGGYITRYFGRPDQHQHALQLEMSKINYMDDEEKEYDSGRAEKIRQLLEQTLRNLARVLEQ